MWNATGHVADAQYDLMSEMAHWLGGAFAVLASVRILGRWTLWPIAALYMLGASVKAFWWDEQYASPDIQTATTGNMLFDGVGVAIGILIVLITDCTRSAKRIETSVCDYLNRKCVWALYVCLCNLSCDGRWQCYYVPVDDEGPGQEETVEMVQAKTTSTREAETKSHQPQLAPPLSVPEDVAVRLERQGNMEALRAYQEGLHHGILSPLPSEPPASDSIVESQTLM